MDELLAGVDIGGSHITAALVNARNGEILNDTWRRLNVNSQDNADSIVSTWCDAIQQSFSAQNLSPTRLGIAMPGPLDYEKGICLIKDQNKYNALYGLNIKELLAGKLHISINDINIGNDAACFLRGETFGGDARNYKHALGLTLGTGFGAARSIDGIAEDADLWCSPFKDGIAEDYLSTRWFIKRYQELAKKTVKDVKTLMELVDENRYARQVCNEFSDHLAEFLIPYIRAEKFELVILGGNISRSFPLFSNRLKKVLEQNSVLPEIRQSRLGENAALVGAASCFYDVFVNEVPHS